MSDAMSRAKALLASEPGACAARIFDRLRALVAETDAGQARIAELTAENEQLRNLQAVQAGILTANQVAHAAQLAALQRERDEAAALSDQATVELEQRQGRIRALEAALRKWSAGRTARDWAEVDLLAAARALVAPEGSDE